MAIEITSNYSNGYESTYGNQRLQAAKKEETKETTEAKKTSSTGSNSNDYLSKLQKQVPSMILGIGNAIAPMNDRRVGTLTLHPDILAKMKADPEQEEYYIQRMKDIARAEKEARSITNALGSTTVCSHWYIDQDGKIWHSAITVRKDKLNEKLRKEAKENAEKLIEKTQEKARKKKEELEELLEEKAEEARENDKEQEETVAEAGKADTEKDKAEKMIADKLEQSEDGVLSFNEEEIQTLIEAAREEAEEKGAQEKALAQKPATTGTNFDMQI